MNLEYLKFFARLIIVVLISNFFAFGVQASSLEGYGTQINPINPIRIGFGVPGRSAFEKDMFDAPFGEARIGPLHRFNFFKSSFNFGPEPGDEPYIFIPDGYETFELFQIFGFKLSITVGRSYSDTESDDSSDDESEEPEGYFWYEGKPLRSARPGDRFDEFRAKDGRVWIGEGRFGDKPASNGGVYGIPEYGAWVSRGGGASSAFNVKVSSGAGGSVSRPLSQVIPLSGPSSPLGRSSGGVDKGLVGNLTDHFGKPFIGGLDSSLSGNLETLGSLAGAASDILTYPIDPESRKKIDRRIEDARGTLNDLGKLGAILVGPSDSFRDQAPELAEEWDKQREALLDAIESSAREMANGIVDKLKDAGPMDYVDGLNLGLGYAIGEVITGGAAKKAIKGIAGAVELGNAAINSGKAGDLGADASKKFKKLIESGGRFEHERTIPASQANDEYLKRRPTYRKPYNDVGSVVDVITKRRERFYRVTTRIKNKPAGDFVMRENPAAPPKGYSQKDWEEYLRRRYAIPGDVEFDVYTYAEVDAGTRIRIGLTRDNFKKGGGSLQIEPLEPSKIKWSDFINLPK